MISASWPMPKSYTAPVKEISEQDSRIKTAIDDFQKKGKLKDLSESEKTFLQECLSQAMNELASKILIKSVIENLKGDIITHDLDDVYDPQGKIPFPKIPFPQPSLFNDSSL